MKKNNYQLFEGFIEPVLKTWSGESQKERALYGIFEETGEVIGKFKKRLRGDEISDLEIKKELGDLLYYLRIFAEVEEIKIIENKKEFKDFSIDYFLKRFSLSYFYLFSKKDKNINFNEILILVFALIDFLKFDLEEILNINSEKLNDRKKRKVIKGTGDNR